jgi:hypothetical protein
VGGAFASRRAGATGTYQCEDATGRPPPRSRPRRVDGGEQDALERFREALGVVAAERGLGAVEPPPRRPAVGFGHRHPAVDQIAERLAGQIHESGPVVAAGSDIAEAVLIDREPPGQRPVVQARPHPQAGVASGDQHPSELVDGAVVGAVGGGLEARPVERQPDAAEPCRGQQREVVGDGGGPPEPHLAPGVGHGQETPGRVRYSRWDGTQVGFDLDADSVLAEINDDLLYHGDLNAALRRMLNSGFDDRNGERVQGLRDLMEKLRQQRRERLEQYDLGGVYDDIAEQLRDVVDTERAALDRLARRGRAHPATSAARRSPTRRWPSATCSSTCCRPTSPAWCGAVQNYDFVSAARRASASRSSPSSCASSSPSAGSTRWPGP